MKVEVQRLDYNVHTEGKSEVWVWECRSVGMEGILTVNVSCFTCAPRPGPDVICFAKMKTEFRREIQAFENLHGSGVKKRDFAGVFGWAFQRVFDDKTVKAAFAATGVWPVNSRAER